jgi:cell division transport system ATP-binding protein
MIRLYNVYKEYNGKSVALADINAEIPDGMFLFITGPSGAGKTTLLKLLFRAERPTRGTIIVNNRNVLGIPDSKIPELRRQMGIVFQDFKLLKNMTVFENITFIQKILGVPLSVRKKATYEILQRVGIDHKMKELPTHLSGGEQQRVAIARALITKPKLVIADEPTGNLDPEMSQVIMDLLLDFNRETGSTILVATHDRMMIKKCKQHVLELRDSKLLYFGPVA